MNGELKFWHLVAAVLLYFGKELVVYFINNKNGNKAPKMVIKNCGATDTVKNAVFDTKRNTESLKEQGTRNEDVLADLVKDNIKSSEKQTNLLQQVVSELKNNKG